nr:hypothetical protein [Massilia sp. MS-15]
MLRRLRETPAEFLAEPRIGSYTGAAGVVVPALVHDLMRMHGHAPSPRWLAALGGIDPRARRNRLALAMITCWLLADPWFLARPLPLPLDALCAVFDSATPLLAQATAAHRFAADAADGEELVRVVLARLGYRPAGETAAQAEDRLAAVSGAARRRLLEASRAAEKRARAVREALARKAAQEAADKWTRE